MKNAFYLLLSLGLAGSIAWPQVYPSGPNGPKNMANSMSVVIATDQTQIPVGITSYPSPMAVNGNVTTLPASMTQVTSYPPLPAGTNHAGSVNVDNFPAVQPVSGTVTANAGTGTFTVGQATGANLHADIDNFPASQAVTVQTSPVPVAGGVITLPASMTQVTSYPPLPAGTNHAGSVNVDNFPATQTVNGTVTANAGTGTFTVGQATGANLHADIDNFPATQAVTIQTSPVPVAGGVITLPASMTQVTSYPPLPVGTNHAGSVNVDNFPATQTVAGTVAVSNFPATQAVTIQTSPVPVVGHVVTDPASMTQVTSYPPLPAGTNHAGSVNVDNFPANQTVSGTVTANQGAPGATSWPVFDTTVNYGLSQIYALIQGIYTRLFGHTVVQTNRNDYTITGVGTSSWVQLTSSLPQDANLVEVFDSCGQTLELGIGSPGSEARLFLITPGGNGQVPVHISATNRVSIRAVSAACSTGEIDVNFYN